MAVLAIPFLTFAAPPGALQVCPGGYVAYSITPDPGASGYLWTLPVGVNINGSTGAVILPAPDGYGAFVQFGNASGDFSVQVVFSNGSLGAAIVQHVNVVPIPPTQLSSLILSSQDLPYTWPVGSGQTLTSSGLFNLYEALTSWQGCDSLVKQNIRVIQHQESPDISTCPNNQKHICLNVIQDALSYEWHLPSGMTINGQSGTVTLSGYGGACANVSIGNVSGSITVKAKFAGGASVEVFSQWVTVETLIVKTLQDIILNMDQLPYTWPVDHSTTLRAPGTFTLMATFTSWQGCDSTVFQTIKINPVSTHVYATGFVFFDNNANGVYEPGLGEKPFPGAMVTYGNNQKVTTDFNGNYSIQDPPAGSTIAIQSPNSGFTITPTSRTFDPAMLTGYDFGIGRRDLRVTLTNLNAFRSGAYTHLHLACRNDGIQDEALVQGRIVLPPFEEFIQSKPVPTAIHGDTLIWDLGLTGAGDQRIVDLTIRTKISTSLYTPVSIQALVYPTDFDVNLANNAYLLHGQVTSAYDPNTKSVWPEYVTPQNVDKNAFEYTIRFQNTGNDTAQTVWLVDVLSTQLNVSSLQLLASSHPCQVDFPSPNTVRFQFEKILLPDSSANEAGSHGFVKFSVQPYPGLQPGDAVDNTADIYFDFNEPVQTNTASTQVVWFLNGETPTGSDMLAVPNPAFQQVTFFWKEGNLLPGTLRLFTANGVLAYSMPLEAGVKSAHINPLSVAPGWYIAVMDAGAVRKVKQVLVQRDGGIRRL
jgi:hypothetical protein